jgi:Leucine-rich repeat (LRR) protein
VLTELYCHQNQLTEIDLSNLPALTELYCSENQLTELDLSNLPELTKLVCSQNQLTELDLSNLPVATEAQRIAGNYKKGHRIIEGLKYTIENLKGGIRRGVDAAGKLWEVKMPADYGYLRETEGANSDYIRRTANLRRLSACRLGVIT